MPVIDTLHWDTSAVISLLLILLSAVHVHYMMVRSESIALAPLRPTKGEFNLLVSDILDHGEFNKLKLYRHHRLHIYDHVNRVAYLSYCISKVFCLDYRSAARGGLFHDFFLYDWRERKENDVSRALHGKEHPHIALDNARVHFDVNHREEDIILTHMYPKTKTPPKYLESAVVSMCDKCAALYEYILHSSSAVCALFRTSFSG